MGEYPVERAGHTGEVERLGQETGVPDLAASAAAQEPVELLLDGAVPPRGHLLERPKPVQIVVGSKDLLDPWRTERADQLLLQIGDAHEEAEPLEVRSRKPGTEPGAGWG